MKRVFLGLLLGVAVCAAVSYFTVPNIKQQAYKNGYEEGDRTGVSSGLLTGITQGRNNILAGQKHVRDSVNVVDERRTALQQALRRKRAKVEKPVQNWHVINDAIADPIPG